MFFGLESLLQLHLSVFNPIGLRDYINVVVDLCDMSSLRGFVFYANLNYDLKSRFEINNLPHALNNEKMSSNFFRRMCTSVIFKDVTKNSIVFGSNLDLPQADLAKLTYNKNYYRNNELIYSSLNIFGVDGVLRAYSNKAKFFFAINTRRFKDETDSLFKYFKEISFAKVLSPFKVAENVMMNSTNFQEALHQLSDTKLTAPVFFTTIGMLNDQDMSNNRCVIERSLDSVNQTYCLDKDTWFLAQTNYDRS